MTIGFRSPCRVDHLCAVFVAAYLLVSMGSAFASDGGVPVHFDYRKRVEGSQIIAPLDTGLFGEQVSLYNGATTFTIVDVDVTGNHTLPVRFGRKLPIELQVQGWAFGHDNRLGGIGNWQPDVPYVATTYPVDATPVDLCTAATPLSRFRDFMPWEFYQGATASLPGSGSRPLLDRTSSVPAPSRVSRRFTDCCSPHLDKVSLRGMAS